MNSISGNSKMNDFVFLICVLATISAQIVLFIAFQ